MRDKVKVTQTYSWFHLVLPVMEGNLENGFLIIGVIGVENLQRIRFMSGRKICR